MHSVVPECNSATSQTSTLQQLIYAFAITQKHIHEQLKILHLLISSSGGSHEIVRDGASESDQKKYTPGILFIEPEKVKDNVDLSGI